MIWPDWSPVLNIAVNLKKRLKALLKEVVGEEGRIILFIDEIHTVVGAGKTEGAMDAGNMLKPALSRGELHGHRRNNA